MFSAGLVTVRLTCSFGSRRRRRGFHVEVFVSVDGTGAGSERRDGSSWVSAGNTWCGPNVKMCPATFCAPILGDESVGTS